MASGVADASQQLGGRATVSADQGLAVVAGRQRRVLSGPLEVERFALCGEESVDGIAGLSRSGQWAPIHDVIVG